jgi:hypothetical protein
VTRAACARNTNDRIAEQASLYATTAAVPMVCECSDPDCREFVLISLAAYTELRDGPAGSLVAAGHREDEIGVVRASTLATVAPARLPRSRER